MTITKKYGTWCTLVNSHVDNPDDEVDGFVSGGSTQWRELLEASGALAEIKAEYRRAIDRSLPADVSLWGEEFIGPATPEDGEWDGYPIDALGALDIKACVEDIDLASILERHDIITLEDIGTYKLGSTAKNPSSAASQAMRRLGVKPIARCQIGGQGQAIAVYNQAEVDRALASRPGRGARTDLQATGQEQP